MENLEQIQRTLSEIVKRIPNALRVAFGLGYLVSPTPPDPSEVDDVASFVASVLLPAASEDGDDRNSNTLQLEPGCDAAGDDDRSTQVECAPPLLRIEWASCYMPLHDHDAHFGLTEAGVFGVADGVGGYMEGGVDAGAFSRGLMASALREALTVEPHTPIYPYTLLVRAYEETVESGAPGASTAVVLSLAGKALRWAYVGDSAFAVLRNGKIVHRSKPQQHSAFNCPFQLSGPGELSDSVTTAKTGETPVRDGDVVVAGTDGLFDNVFDTELERIVQMGTALGLSPKNMANIIAGTANEMSRSRVRDSPFNVEYSRRCGNLRHGGKMDDITVVVAYIVT